MIFFIISLSCVSEEKQNKELYDKFCGLCHGYDGEGYLAPQANALGNPEFLSAATDEFLEYATIYGRPATKMSPWGDVVGGPLSESEISGILKHIRTWETLPSEDIHERTITGSVENGLLLYEPLCASCHGPQGEGASALSLNNPTFLESASDGFIYHAIEKGRSGTSMLSYSQDLTEEEMSDLVALIRSWGNE